MPLLEELGYIPTEKYAKGPEIFAHCRRIAEHFDLYRNACLQTEVQEIRWEADSCRWVIATDRGDEIRARFVAMANGYLQKPKLPGIEGITNFAGHTFHTSRWDYEYTGSDLSGLSDKRVGIVGTGATAIQCVPRLAEAVRQLFVFQRTPSTVDVRANRPTEPQWAASLEPGWQQRRMENFQILTAGGTSDEDLVDDAWTSLTRKMPIVNEGGPNAAEMADFAKMEEIRARVEADRHRRRHRRGAQTVVRLLLQAAVFPRRIPAGVQPRQRLPRRHPRPRRRADHRERRRGGRHRIPLGLFDFRHRLRSRHQLLAAHRLRDHRPRRADPDRQVGRRRALAAWRARQRLSELLHRKHRAVRFHRELPLPDRHPVPAHRLGDRLGVTARRRGDGSHRRRRSCLGRHGRATLQRHRRPAGILHAGLLQPRGPRRRPSQSGQLLLRQPNRIRRSPGRLAVRRHAGRGSTFGRSFRSGQPDSATRRITRGFLSTRQQRAR